MTASSNPWSEIHPDAEIVAEELRRVRFEMALATIRERDAFIQDLRETMSHPTRFRDRRKQPKQRRIRVTRQRSTVEFTQRQLALGERILRDLTLREGHTPRRTET